MVKIAKLIGGAGTGKTTALMEVMRKLIDRGVDPLDIGFVSFTRAARAEAAERVERDFGVSSELLQSQGWFRTLHSVCYRQIGARMGDRLLTGKKADRDWLTEAVGYRVSESTGGETLASEDLFRDSTESPADAALALWDLARSSLLPLVKVHQRVSVINSIPPLDFCRRVISAYERAKYVDDRLDFVDLAGRFAGWKWDLDDEPQSGEPEGETPGAAVWIFDEHQDVSPLLDSVASRLTYSDHCRFAYLAGDPFQAIYGFSGADHRCLLDWECDEYRELRQSYRCPSRILSLGEHSIRGCGDYWDRQIAPVREGGTIRETASFAEIREGMDPSNSWLLIARTNHLAQRFYKGLNASGIPWDYTRGDGGYLTPKQRTACSALYRLERGGSIDPRDWTAALRVIPAKIDTIPALQRGVKTRVLAGDFRLPPEQIRLEDLPDRGSTPEFRDAVASGRWAHLIDRAELFTRAADRYGEEVALTPRVRVGTIHSVKGSEADNVVLLSSLSARCAETAKKDAESRDAERRVSYVGVTRAKDRLFVLSPRSDRWRMEIA